MGRAGPCRQCKREPALAVVQNWGHCLTLRPDSLTTANPTYRIFEQRGQLRTFRSLLEYVGTLSREHRPPRDFFASPALSLWLGLLPDALAVRGCFRLSGTPSLVSRCILWRTDKSFQVRFGRTLGLFEQIYFGPTGLFWRAGGIGSHTGIQSMYLNQSGRRSQTASRA